MLNIGWWVLPNLVPICPQAHAEHWLVGAAQPHPNLVGKGVEEKGRERDRRPKVGGGGNMDHLTTYLLQMTRPLGSRLLQVSA